MVDYYITISYSDRNGSLQFVEYRGIVAPDPTYALKRVIGRFHRDRRPIIFEIRRIVIETELSLVR